MKKRSPWVACIVALCVGCGEEFIEPGSDLPDEAPPAAFGSSVAEKSREGAKADNANRSSIELFGSYGIVVEVTAPELGTELTFTGARRDNQLIVTMGDLRGELALDVVGPTDGVVTFEGLDVPKDWLGGREIKVDMDLSIEMDDTTTLRGEVTLRSATEGFFPNLVVRASFEGSSL